MDYSPSDHTLRITTLTHTLSTTLSEASSLLTDLDHLSTRLSTLSSPALSSTSQRDDPSVQATDSPEEVASVLKGVEVVRGEIEELWVDARDSVEDLGALEGRSRELRARVDLSCLEGIWGGSSAASSGVEEGGMGVGGGERSEGLCWGDAGGEGEGCSGGEVFDCNAGVGCCGGEDCRLSAADVDREGRKGGDESVEYEEEEGLPLGDEDEIAYYREEVRMLGWRVDLLEREITLGRGSGEQEEGREDEDIRRRKEDGEEKRGRRMNRGKRDGSRL